MSGHPTLPPDPISLPLLPLRDVVVFPLGCGADKAGDRLLLLGDPQQLPATLFSPKAKEVLLERVRLDCHAAARLPGVRR